MHRYFARRPNSVFSGLVSWYSKEGDVILDPFMGGGVTIVEATIQERRAIGYDINPLSTFITKMEISDLDVSKFNDALDDICKDFKETNDSLFETNCRDCGWTVPAQWFEYSALAACSACKERFLVSDAKKSKIGTWKCPHCNSDVRFSPAADTEFTIVSVCYECPSCGRAEIAPPTDHDLELARQVTRRLAREEREGLWIPGERIPDNNMQRESALFKKGIVQYRQFFTDRHLLALGLLKQTILKKERPLRDWLLFTFSSTLRYTNRMVTRNEAWRKARPLEWAKPGFWLPPVHLEANVLEEFVRRGEAIARGKEDLKAALKGTTTVPARTGEEVLQSREPRTFHVSTRSSTSLPLPDESVDAIITDPPYGSYVFYADLCNFWSVWLPEIEGLGSNINDVEEAVIARKRFPNAKGTAQYQSILEGVFKECRRVLRPTGFMVLTFNNREPRAWASLMMAAMKSGFTVSKNGVIFQNGIPSYRHTAQSRREGSVRGDFIITFEKNRLTLPSPRVPTTVGLSEGEVASMISSILEKNGPMPPTELFSRFYSVFYRDLISRIEDAATMGDPATERLLSDLDRIRLFDSHRKQLLAQHFVYNSGTWSLKR